MNALTSLKSYIGSEKTLVITSTGFRFDKPAAMEEKIFILLAPDGKLQRYDPKQREILQYYIEEKACSQILFIGSRDPMFISQTQNDDLLYSLQTALKFNLSALLKRKHTEIIAHDIKVQMLTEFNVIHQCRLLLDFYFIKEKVEKNKLHVKGVVPEIKSEQFKSIFYDDIVYNDILTLN